MEDKRPSGSSVEHFATEAENQHITISDIRSPDSGAHTQEDSEPPRNQCEEQAEMYD